VKDEEWRALAARNPMRVTYPSWRPKEFWAERAKKDPWVPVEDNRNFWQRTRRKAARRIAQAKWPGAPEPSGPPSGMKIEPRPSSWDNVFYHSRGRKYQG
jgi:hypothetical protein